MRSPIGYGPLEPAYPDETLKRGGKAKRKAKRATVDKSIKINIRNVQQQQRDIVHVMKGKVPPTPNIMPNSSRVFSAPSIHYAYAPPQYYGNAPSVTQPLSVMKDISTQRNVPKKDPEPETVWDNNPAGIIAGVDYSVRAQPKSEERKYEDRMADMRASRASAFAFAPFENEEDDTEALVRQHDAVTTPLRFSSSSGALEERQRLVISAERQAQSRARRKQGAEETEEDMPSKSKGGELINALSSVSGSAFPGFGSWLGEQLGNEYAKHTRGRGGIMPVAKSGLSTFASMF